MRYGYARTSTKSQKVDFQIDALTQAGCQKIFTDIASGSRSDRPNLNKLTEELREGDTLVVWKIDRLGRSLKHLVELVDQLNKRNIGLLSLNDPIDTTTSHGKLVFNIFASLAEFERSMIRERTKAGLDAARARGKIGGRPKGLSEKAKITACAAESLYRDKSLSIREIYSQLGISRATLYSYLRHRNVAVG